MGDLQMALRALWAAPGVFFYLRVGAEPMTHHNAGLWLYSWRHSVLGKILPAGFFVR